MAEAVGLMMECRVNSVQQMSRQVHPLGAHSETFPFDVDMCRFVVRHEGWKDLRERWAVGFFGEKLAVHFERMRSGVGWSGEDRKHGLWVMTFAMRYGRQQ
jgi:hypothetical protein